MLAPKQVSNVLLSLEQLDGTIVANRYGYSSNKLLDIDVALYPN